MDLFHDSPLFALIYYKLWIFNYKYHVVAVVRPQSCLHLLLAIQVIPSQLLSLLSYYTLLWITEPLNHWTLASIATMLTSSIPRPCKVLTNVATCVTSTQSITASWTLLNNFGVQQNFDTAQPPGQPQSWQWRSWKRIPLKRSLSSRFKGEHLQLPLIMHSPCFSSKWGGVRIEGWSTQALTLAALRLPLSRMPSS